MAKTKTRPMSGPRMLPRARRKFARATEAAVRETLGGGGGWYSTGIEGRAMVVSEISGFDGQVVGGFRVRGSGFREEESPSPLPSPGVPGEGERGRPSDGVPGEGERGRAVSPTARCMTFSGVR